MNRLDLQLAVPMAMTYVLSNNLSQIQYFMDSPDCEVFWWV